VHSIACNRRKQEVTSTLRLHVNETFNSQNQLAIMHVNTFHSAYTYRWPNENRTFSIHDINALTQDKIKWFSPTCSDSMK